MLRRNIVCGQFRLAELNSIIIRHIEKLIRDIQRGKEAKKMEALHDCLKNLRENYFDNSENPCYNGSEMCVFCQEIRKHDA